MTAANELMYGPESESRGSHISKWFLGGNFDNHGRAITSILGTGEDFVVYIVEGKVVDYQHDNLSDDIRSVIAEFHRLAGVAEAVLGGRFRRELNSLLGRGLLGAFSTRAVDEAKLYFVDADRFVEEKYREDVNRNYLLSSTLVGSVIAFALLYWLWSNQIYAGEVVKNLVTCCLGGTVGALFSALYRGIFPKSDMAEPGGLFVSWQDLLVRSSCRILLGLILGAIAFAANKSNLAFGFVENVYGLFVLSVASGFNERVALKIMKKFVGKK